jgi:hypothetical protein
VLLQLQEAYFADQFLPQFDILTNDSASQVPMKVALWFMKVAIAINRRNPNAEVIPFFT